MNPARNQAVKFLIVPGPPRAAQAPPRLGASIIAGRDSFGSIGAPAGTALIFFR